MLVWCDGGVIKDFLACTYLCGWFSAMQLTNCIVIVSNQDSILEIKCLRLGGKKIVIDTSLIYTLKRRLNESLQSFCNAFILSSYRLCVRMFTVPVLVGLGEWYWVSVHCCSFFKEQYTKTKMCLYILLPNEHTLKPLLK